MRNQLQTFLLPDDEQALSDRLRLADPTLYFIDEQDAGQDTVGIHTSLLECESGFAWIWRSGSTDAGESAERWRAQVQARSMTATMQFLRSRPVQTELITGQQVHALRGGRLAACFRGTGTDAQKKLKKITYKALDEVASKDVVQIDPVRRVPIDKRTGLRVGPCASEWCSATDHLLIDWGTNFLYYAPQSVLKAM